MKDIKVGIIDYGAGNNSSVKNSLKELGIRSIISKKPIELEKCDIIIIPGVGSYTYAMQELTSRDLIRFIKRHVLEKRGLIGICLGMQILTDAGCEGGNTEGLGLIEGKTYSMKNGSVKTGWDRVKIKKNDISKWWLESSKDAYLYFNHSYYVVVDEQYIIAVSEYNPDVPAIIRKDNIIGLQFHPEKSQEEGRKLLYNTLLELTDGY